MSLLLLLKDSITTVTASDSAAISVSETSAAAIQTNQTASDTASLSIAETSSIVVTNSVTASDTSSVTIAERASRAIAGQNNRLLNSSFEDGTHLWTVAQGAATLQVVDTDAFDGGKALRITATSTAFLEVRSESTPVNPNLYTNLGFGLAVRLVSGSMPTPSMGIRSTLVNGSNTNVSTSPTISSAWGRYTFASAGTMNVNAVSSQLTLSGSVTAGTVIEIDAAQLNELNTTVTPAYDPTTTPHGIDSPSVSVSDRSSRAIVGQNNRFLNTSFEDGTTDWTVRTGAVTLSVVDTDAADGGKAMRVVVNTSGTFTLASPKIPVNPVLFTNIGAAISVRRPVGAVAPDLRIEPTRGNGSTIGAGAIGITALSPTTWKRQTHTNGVALDSTVEYGVLSFTATNAVAGDTYEIDAVQLNELTNTTVPAFDPITPIPKSASDTGSVSVTESVDIFDPNAATPIVASDTGSLAIAESTSMFVAVATTDTSSVSIADTSASSLTLSRTDTASVAIADTSSPQVSMTRTDTSSVAIADSSSVVISQAVVASDTSSVAIADSSASSLTLSRTDTSSVAVGDTSAPLISMTRPDTASVSISEVATASGTVTTTDTSGLSVAESSAVGINTFVSASDTSSLSIDDTSQITKNLSTTDTSSISIADTSSLFKQIDSTDTASVSIAEARTLVVLNSVSATDTGSLSIADASTNNIQGVVSKSGTDTATVAVADASGIQVSESKTAADTAAVAISETTTFFRILSATDNNALVISDTTLVFKNPSTTDTGSIAIADTSALLKQIPANDTASLSITEATATAVDMTRSDTAALSISETTAFAPVAAQGDDTATLDLTEQTEITVVLSTDDSASLAIDESSGVQEFAAISDIDASDELIVHVTERSNTHVPGDEEIVIIESSGTVGDEHVSSSSDTTVFLESDASAVDDFAFDTGSGIIIE